MNDRTGEGFAFFRWMTIRTNQSIWLRDFELPERHGWRCWWCRFEWGIHNPTSDTRP
jgi:hypothetical protein